jgi:hypothetical protein
VWEDALPYLPEISAAKTILGMKEGFYKITL